MALLLEDYAGKSIEDVRKSITWNYEVSREEIDKYEILIAYQSVGPWGCDSSAFLLLRDKETGDLFENHGSHCSCYGFEEQFTPEKTSVEYLKSIHSSFIYGGYDEDIEEHKVKIRQYIERLGDENE